MQCLNIKNKEVAALLKEYTEIFGNEDAAYYVLSENNGYGLDKAPNGADSKLFSDLLSYYNGDRNKAILAKSKVYTDSFKNWFGDWLSDNKTNISKVVDENGEPLIVYHGSNHNIIEFDKQKLGGNTGKGEYRDKTTGEVVEIDSNNAFFASSNKLVAASYSFLGTQQRISELRNKIEDLYTVLTVGQAYNGTVKNRNDVNKTFKELAEQFPELKSLVEQVPETGKIPEEVKNKLIENLNTLNKRYSEIDNNYSGRSFTNQYNYYIKAINKLNSWLTDENLNKLKSNDKSLFEEDQASISLSVGKDSQSIYLDDDGRYKYVGLDGRRGYLDTLSIPQLRKLLIRIINSLKSGLKQVNEDLKKSTYANTTYVGYYYVNMKNPLVHDYNGSSFPDKYVNQKGEKTEYPTGYIAGRQVKKAMKDGNDGVIYHNLQDPLLSDSYGFFDPNQIKSIDNQGTFSTQDNNIYNQQAQSQTGTGRNEELARLLQTLYPKIEIGTLTDPNLRGQAHVEGNMAGKVLLNAVLENQDTLPHEYAHHYIAWFRNAPIVQNGIKQFGSEESLVQAIGENSVKATKWYNRFFNWIKGLFNKKQATLNTLTNNFLKGGDLQYVNNTQYRVYNQTVNEIPNQIHKVYEDIMTGIERRISDFKYSKFSNDQENELRRLQFQMNQFENDKAVFEFVDYMARDVYEALDRVNTLLFKVREDLKYNNPISVSPAELDLIKKGYIGFYGNIATNIQNMLDDQDTFIYINDPKLIEEVKQSLNKTISNYYELVRNYNNVVDIIAKENFIAEASKAGSFTIDELRQKLEEGDKDINLWNQWVGSTQYSDSEIVRLILNKIATAKNKVAEEELIKGKHLTDLLSKVDKSKLSLLHEKNKKGHKTGFMTRDLNYGEHYEMYLAHQRKLADDLGFADKEISEVPGLLNPEQLKIWNKANNDWDAKYTIRKFTPEYYELTNSLSEDARSRRDEINMEINLLLRPTVDESGDYHREDLSDEDYLKLQELETRRRNLANPFYTDGTVKVGLDKKIADEIRAYNKKLRDKLHYEPNMEKFNKARKKAKENLSAEKYAKWVQRNTVEQIVEEFWEDVKKLSSVQVKSEDQILYEEARRNLLRLYMREDGTIDVDSMPDQAKDLINTYDSMIYQERMMNKEEGVKSRVMEIAEWEINPKYYAEFEKAENAGEAAFNAWAVLNTTVDGKGNIVPASFWKRLVPKKELRSKYTRRVPNRSWSEVDKESPFYDKRFTKYVGRGETRIPNPKYFDNSSNYNKIISDKNLKALYDALVDTYAEANSEISFMRYSNNYKLAQIEGGAWTQIMAKDNILKGLGYAIADSWTVKDDDNMYMLENAKRSDGSLVKLVPTRYIKMLSDPNTLTNDIVGSTIAYYKMAKNYKEMSEIAPELEIALDFVSRMNFTNSKGGRIEGIESKTYDKLKDTINRLVYGMERDAAEFDINLPFSDKQFRVSLDKFVSNVAAYTRIQGISQNLNVILTGLITNKIQIRLEAMSGIYFSNKELAQATKILMPSYVYALKNIGKSNNKDKVLCYLEYLGIVRENSQTFSKLNQSRLLRALNQHFWYFGHEMTDYITKGKLAIAIGLYYKYDPELNKFVNKHEFLRRFKNKKEGKAKWNTLTTTFFDAFEVENNVLVPKKKYQKALDEVTINKIKNTAKQVGTRIDTQITDLDKSKLHSTVIGQLLLIYRNFILVNLQTKFLTKRQFNYSTGMWSEAQWPAAINAIKTIYNHYYNPDKINQLRELYKDHYDELTEYEKGCLKRVTYEVLFSTLGFFIISSILRSMADDDKRNWWKQESAYLALRASLETRGNILPIEVINMLNTPTAAWTTLQGLFDMCASIMEDGSEEVVRGPYKGMTRFERSLIKITPLRSIWEARDPRSKMEYYDNMISIFNF